MARRSKKERPNILLIAIDSLVSTHMSCYGYPKLTQFVKSLGAFDIEHRATNNPSVKHTYIRNKDGEAAPAPAKPAKPIGKFTLRQSKPKKAAAKKK